MRGRLPELREEIPLADWDAFLASADESIELPDVDPASQAQVLYTSGTTGLPKAAVLTHHGLTNNARLAWAAAGLRPGEIAVNPMPLFHVAGAGMITLGLVQYACAQVLPPYFEPGLVLELAQGGENVYPREIEDVLLGHRGVAQVAVTGVASAFWGEEIGAVIRPAGAAAPEADELSEFCRQRLAAYKVPAHWMFLDNFPLTATGKVRKDVLSARFAGASGR